MPRHSPYRIELTDEERAVLESLARSYTLPYWQVTRAQMVLMAADGLRNEIYASPDFDSSDCHCSSSSWLACESPWSRGAIRACENGPAD